MMHDLILAAAVMLTLGSLLGLAILIVGPE